MTCKNAPFCVILLLFFGPMSTKILFVHQMKQLHVIIYSIYCICSCRCPQPKPHHLILLSWLCYRPLWLQQSVREEEWPLFECKCSVIPFKSTWGISSCSQLLTYIGGSFCCVDKDQSPLLVHIMPINVVYNCLQSKRLIVYVNNVQTLLAV